MQSYQNQVELLLNVLPVVAREDVFALHGGTAINLFVRNMPRLSVDIDLTYLPLDSGNREAALFTEEVKQGFMLGLISSGRPLHEIIRPNFLDQRATMANHFEGMSADPFSYEDFEAYREKLVDIIHSSLTERDKEFLLSFKKLTPNWEIHDFERFPSVQWKLKNLRDLKVQNPSKLQDFHDELERKLFR